MGPDLLSAGLCSEKLWGPVNWGGRPYFSWEKIATFLVITVRVSAVSSVSSPQKVAICFFAHHSRFTRGLPIFPACKNVPLLLLAPFCGASDRPNMLNMPKSAAGLRFDKVKRAFLIRCHCL